MRIHLKTLSYQEIKQSHLFSNLVRILFAHTSNILLNYLILQDHC